MRGCKSEANDTTSGAIQNHCIAQVSQQDLSARLVGDLAHVYVGWLSVQLFVLQLTFLSDLVKELLMLLLSFSVCKLSILLRTAV